MIEFDEQKFIAALNEVAATPEGKILLAGLKDACQWDKTYLASDNPALSHYYAVKRGIYGGLREHIKPLYLKIIEFDHRRKHGTKPATEPSTSTSTSDTGTVRRAKLQRTRKLP